MYFIAPKWHFLRKLRFATPRSSRCWYPIISTRKLEVLAKLHMLGLEDYLVWITFYVEVKSVN